MNVVRGLFRLTLALYVFALVLLHLLLTNASFIEYTKFLATASLGYWVLVGTVFWVIVGFRPNRGRECIPDLPSVETLDELSGRLDVVELSVEQARAREPILHAPSIDTVDDLSSRLDEIELALEQARGPVVSTKEDDPRIGELKFAVRSLGERLTEMERILEETRHRTLTKNEKDEERFERGKPLLPEMLRKGGMLRLMRREFLEIGAFEHGEWGSRGGWAFLEHVYRHESLESVPGSSHQIARGEARAVGADSWEPLNFEVPNESTSGGEDIRVVDPDKEDDENEHRHFMLTNEEYQRGHYADDVQARAWSAWRRGCEPDPADIVAWARKHRDRLIIGRPDGPPPTDEDIAAARPSNRSPWRDRNDPDWRDERGRRRSETH